MTTVYCTSFLDLDSNTLSTTLELVAPLRQSAVDSSVTNHWHNAMRTSNCVTMEDIPFPDLQQDVNLVVYYTTDTNEELVVDDTEVIAALTKALTVSTEGEYQILEHEGITYDILWWPIDED